MIASESFVPETQQAAVEQYLQKKPVNFSQSLLQAWANANDHITFNFVANERVALGNDGNTITLPSQPTLKDILTAAQLITKQPENKSRLAYRNTGLERLGRKLTDSAIVLAKEQGSDDQYTKQVIEDLFSLGATLYIRANRADATPLAFSYEQIKLLEIVPDKHPTRREALDNQEKRKAAYKTDLFLFLLGKDSAVEDHQGNVVPNTSAYDILYHQWLENNHEKQNTLSLKQKFEESIRGQLPQLALENVLSLNGEHWLEQITTQRVLQRLDEAVQERGQTLLEKEMPVPPEANNLGEELQKELEKIYGPDFKYQFTNAQITLYQTAEKIMKDLPKKTTIKEKIVTLWDLVQAYKYAKTYIPKKAIALREIECGLRAYLLSGLLNKYLGENVAIFQDSTAGHSSLMVVEKHSLDKKNPVGYFVDPVITRARHSVNDAVYQIKDNDFVLAVAQAYKQNHTHVDLNLITSDLERLWGPSHNYHHIISVDPGIRADLWTCLAEYNEQEARTMYLKAINISPNRPSFWYNLGTTYSDDRQTARKYFLKTLELMPIHNKALFGLAWSLEYEKKIRSVLDKNTLVGLTQFLQQLCAGTIKPEWLTPSQFNLAKKILARLNP